MKESPPISLAHAAEAIVACGRRLAAAGLVAGADGNISVRLTRDTVLVTPAGASKGALAAEQLVAVRLADGAVVRGARRASSELAMHLHAYRARPDVGAVLHAHPPHATAFAAAGMPVVAEALPEIILTLGRVPTVPYARPGTPAVGEGVAAALAGADAVLLANHGATVVGRTLDEAWSRLETLEHAARILWLAHALGGARPLDPAEVAALDARRREAVPRPGVLPSPASVPPPGPGRS